MWFSFKLFLSFYYLSLSVFQYFKISFLLRLIFPCLPIQAANDTQRILFAVMKVNSGTQVVQEFSPFINTNNNKDMRVI